MAKLNLAEIFPRKKPIIGMIHLAGQTSEEMVKRGLEELALYDREGIDGAIVEDYHGTPREVHEVLKKMQELRLKLAVGINLLRNPYSAFELAHKYGVRFIQFDSVQTGDLDFKKYHRLRKTFPSIAVLGGVGFKYTEPTGNPLEQDLNEARERCEVIVTTGAGTGIETPIEKLKAYKRILGDFYLFSGAGVTAQNIQEQLSAADGAIIGSYFKPNGNTHLPVDAGRVRECLLARNQKA